MEAMDPKRKLLVVTYVGVWTKVYRIRYLNVKRWGGGGGGCARPLY